MTRFFFFFLLPTLVASSCKDEPGATCRQAAAHYADMVNAELAKEGDAERLQQARRHLPTLQNSIQKTCEAAEWPQSTLECMVGARTVEELTACDPRSQSPSQSSGASGTKSSGSATLPSES